MKWRDPNRVHGYVWHSHSGYTGFTWHYAVMFGDRVILYDNTGKGGYADILRACLIEVAALRHMVIAEHKLEPYTGGHARPPQYPRRA